MDEEKVFEKVAKLVNAGKSEAEIANDMRISKHTVKSYKIAIEKAKRNKK